MDSAGEYDEAGAVAGFLSRTFALWSSSADRQPRSSGTIRMASENKEQFGSRLGMMLAMLGMAVGTGNIWRFPRIAASNGGGEFLVAWIVFLLLWSIPLILLEFGMGRMTRSGPVKAFILLMGPRWAWMGAFAVFVTTAITFYYSVVAGWTVRFTLATVMAPTLCVTFAF